MRRRFAVWLPLCLLAAAPAAMGLEGFRYSRPVEVEQAGRVRLPLDLETLHHAAAGLEDLHLFDPEGGEVPFRLEALAPENERRPAKVTSVRRTEDGWWVTMDLGPQPPRHSRLSFRFRALAVAPAVRLEGSGDGRQWHPLARGDLFRLGTGDGLGRRRLRYPATGDRFLRLHWPREAGFPELEGASVETSTGPTLEVSGYQVSCERLGPGHLDCRLPLTVRRQMVRQLIVELSATGDVAFRLYGAAAGRWRELESGVWRDGMAAAGRVLALGDTTIAGDRLRLELWERGGEPRLAGYRAELAVPTLLFHASVPGRYTLAYGAVSEVRNQGGRERRTGEGGSFAWVAAGAEREHPSPPLPARLTEPGRPLSPDDFRSAWDVFLSQAAPGDLVRLPLPDEVYGSARPDLADVRLVVGARQIPYVRLTPAEPAAVLRRWDLAAGPRASEEKAGTSRLELDLPAPRLPLTELVVSAPPVAFERPVSLVPHPATGARVSVDEPPARAVAAAHWTCRGDSAPLPCRLALDLDRSPASAAALELRFDDGDNPPLRNLEVDLWRRRDALFFVWPQSAGRVRLLAGSPGLAPPRYDLAALADLLPVRPWREASLQTVARGGVWERSRWPLLATLALAAVALLALLGRILRSAG